jgi:hypothetical protein
MRTFETSFFDVLQCVLENIKSRGYTKLRYLAKKIVLRADCRESLVPLDYMFDIVGQGASIYPLAQTDCTTLPATLWL